MLSSKDKDIVTLFSARIRERFPGARIWAFGSRAKGFATDESDLDVCVVVDTLDEEKDQQILKIAWEVGFENDVVISTVTYSKQDFEEGPCSESPLVQTILDAGVAA
ncbi:MAG: nucleotidyltransferase domain-containing protein [Deltaproteobacteria bacterium HGW-Deltaproteobacteria-21]|nr:MAG: nucleotidyltransferase domain-containing protein [Deltaproteobacteria bacterium HGW-Deltaproteobacteria-21]